MKHQRLIILVIFALMIVITALLARWDFENALDVDKYPTQVASLQTTQAKTYKDMKILLAQQLASQARSINIEDNSKQMIGVLLAVQSMKMSPTIEASQVLQSNLHTRPISLFQHGDSVLSAAFSPDGKFAVTGSADHIARVWEIASGKEITHMTHNDSVQSVAFSPNGKYIASASADNTIRIWDSATGEEVVHMTHIGPKLRIIYSSDGKYIISSSSDRTARVWNTTTGKEVAHWLHGDSITAIAFSPDSRHVATGSADNTARVFDTTTGQEIARVTHYKPVTAIAFSSDGKYVVSGSMDGAAKSWNADTGEEAALILSGGTESSSAKCEASVTSVAFSPDEKFIALGCQDVSPLSKYPYNENITIRIWRTSIDGLKEYYYYLKIPFTDTVTSLGFSPNSKYLLTSSEDHTARVWEVSSGREISRMTHDDAITSIAFSADGKQVMSSSLDHTARVWETLPWQEAMHGNNSGSIAAIALSPDGKYIASGGRDGTILIQEMITGQEVVQMKLGGKNPSKDITANPRIYWMSQSEENGVSSIAFSPDGKFIASGSADNTVRIWDVAKGQEISRMLPDYYAATQNGTTYYISGVYSVAFSPDGKYVASGGTDGDVYVWEVSSKKEIARLAPLLKNAMTPYVSYNALSIAFSPDGKYVVSGSTDKTVRIWEIETQREVASPGFSEGEFFSPSAANSIAFSPNGRYVAWGGGMAVHVWDTVKKQEILRMNHDHTMYSIEGGTYSPEDDGHSSLGTVNSVTYSHDGKYILSASSDNTVRIWDAVTGQEISRIVHHVYDYSSGYAGSVAITPNGKYVISRDASNTINLWLWRPEDLVADACSRLPRNLTREEWTKYTEDMIPYQAVCPNLPIGETEGAQQ